jgi:hypothetical protein
MSISKAPDKSALLVEMRGTPAYELPPDHTDRDEILRKALAYLSRRGVSYVSLDVEEDIQLSYDDDSLDKFRETVRGWIRELVKEAA